MKLLSDLLNKNTKAANSLFGKLIRGGFVSLSVRVIGLSLGLVANVVLSRLLGVSGYGSYAIIIGWVMISIVPVKFGLDISVLRFASIYIDKKQYSSLRSFISFVFKFLITTSVISGLILIALTGFKPSVVGAPDIPHSVLMAVLVSALAFLGVFQGFFRSAHKIFLSQFFEQILRSFLMIAFLILFWLIFENMTLFDAVAITAMAAVLSSLAMIIPFRKILNRGEIGIVESEASNDTPSKWIAVSWPLLIATFAGVGLTQAGTIMVGMLADHAAAGSYSAAARLAAFVPYVLVALNSMTAPMVAASFHRGDFRDLKKIAKINAWFSSIGAIAISAVFVVGGYRILSLFGPGFSDAYPAMLVMLAAGVLHSALGPTAAFLAMTNMQIAGLFINLAGLMTALIIGLVLIPQYGTLGAAVAYSSGFVFQKIISIFIIRSRIGIDCSILGFHRKSQNS